MQTLYRWLFGYRDDLDLAMRWWHRLFKVTSSIMLAIVVLGVFAGTLNQRNDQALFLFLWISVLAGLVCAVLNLYYRGFVYIICGGRRKVR